MTQTWPKKHPLDRNPGPHGWIDAGDGVLLRHSYAIGPLGVPVQVAIVHAHQASHGWETRLLAFDTPTARALFEQDAVRFVSHDGQTVHDEIGCRSCGLRGRIVDGRWVKS